MDKFKTVLNIAGKQTNLGFGLIALLTAGGEQIFSAVVFKCPCNELNFVYGIVFLLVPALALLLLGYILSKKTWKLLTGLCRRSEKLLCCKKLVAAGVVLCQIGTFALVAPSTWIAVALLNGNYYECAMTGTNVSIYNKHVCRDRNSEIQCEKELHRFPCGKSISVPQAVREDVLLNLRAESQILGWMLITLIMLTNLVFTCVARCSSPISYLQLQFWKAYVHEESNLLDSYTAKHAKAFAERNLKTFFEKIPPENVITPSNRDWEKISSLYKFTSKDTYYSTLHRYVENCQETDNGMMRMSSVKSNESVEDNPAVLSFVDDGRMPL
ncbi:calcium homeostasis modulator protein 6 [Haplochromis burtoni]|uniref:Calcium homeostasis modulator family member 6 n=1 Tax=Haplochromis burtoni TaxID=8153 RepID=A0A3Q2WTY8_HAPBU|nr:calcium homeostasis modulator protein 6 [Haplochromis burtoni]